MPLLTENSFARLSDPILEPAEQTTLALLEKIKELAQSLIENPEQTVNNEAIRREVEQLWSQYQEEFREWVNEAMPKAYLRGIKKTNGAVPSGMEAQFGITPNIELAAAAGIAGGGGEIASRAAEILEEHPRHHTIYTAFQDAAYNRFNETRIPVIRDVQGKIRDLTIQASEAAYRDADGFTRRKLTQQLMDKFADDNITGIRYADGRTMKLDTYSEMVARSQTGNAARQASINRQQEYNLDLIQISQHFPTSDLCRPHQGKVYSLSGTSDKYPPFESTNPGAELYHSMCKHYQSAYIPGVSELPDEEMTVTKNREQYKLTQKQRYNERMTRKWKRREATALTDEAREDARQKVRQWQKRNRELVSEHDFLRRAYHRESI